MANSLSPFFDDELVVENLRLFFDYEVMLDFDFTNILGAVVDRGTDLYLEFRGRKFSIDKVTGNVSEVT